MANRGQLRRLKQGGADCVAAWNQWRQANSEVQINLRGANLKGVALPGVDLSGADIRGARFDRADLTGASFVKAQAGLEKFWAICLTLLALVFALVSGILSGYAGNFVNLIFASLPEEIVAGWISSLELICFYILLLRKDNVFAEAVARVVAGIIVGPIAGAVVGVIIGVFAVAAVVAVEGAEAATGILPSISRGMLVGATVGAIAVAEVVIGAVVVAISSSVVKASAGIIVSLAMIIAAGVSALAFAETLSAGAFAGAFAIALTSLNAYIGWRALVGDERYSSVHSIVIAVAVAVAVVASDAMYGTRFHNAQLINTDFSEAQLRSTDLRNAIVVGTNWHKSKGLDYALFGGTILDVPAIRNLAVSHNGRGKSYVGQNLKSINLRGADLTDANLTEADISDATLAGATLERANLTKVQALRTQFRQANLTAACIESWNIDSTTQLEGVVCNHVYLLNGQQERRPNSGQFKDGEFTKLFQKVFDTIDLIFHDGVDWKTFVETFKQIQLNNEESELALQSIENKGDGVVVVKVRAKLYVDTAKINNSVDKAKIHEEFIQKYEHRLQLIQAQYKAQLESKDKALEAKDEVIESYKKHGKDMMTIAETLAKAQTKQFNQINLGGTNFQNEINDGKVNQGETINDT